MQMNNENNPENSPLEELGIGDLLRTEREKKGMSKGRLAEVIKVRECVIDSLEKEEWDKLPARVFIKGFIRSYTIAIGYDTKKALRLFDKSLPSRGEDSPVPLTGIRNKNRTLYYAVPILIILAVIVYLFVVKDKGENNIEPVPAVSETSADSTETVQEPEFSGQADAVETPVPEGVKETTPKESKIEKTIHAEPEKKITVREEPLQTPDEKSEGIKIENTPAEEPGEAVYEEELTEPATVDSASPASMMTLSAMVNESTYVKIIVDDNPPKEYIFQPGANPSWTAERGFEVTIGNAAGIEFEFSGETFKNLGREGRVKTLRFPKDFKTNWEEE